jgi:hypothetical protein
MLGQPRRALDLARVLGTKPTPPRELSHQMDFRVLASTRLVFSFVHNQDNKCLSHSSAVQHLSRRHRGNCFWDTTDLIKEDQKRLFSEFFELMASGDHMNLQQVLDRN